MLQAAASIRKSPAMTSTQTTIGKPKAAVSARGFYQLKTTPGKWTTAKERNGGVRSRKKTDSCIMIQF